MSTFYIEQKLVALNNKYFIYNSKDELYFEVTTKGVFAVLDKLLGGIISIGHEMEIKEMDGNSFSIIKKKPGVVSEKYSVYYDKDYQGKIKQHIVALKPKISIITKEDTYMVKGDIMAREFYISRSDGKDCAKISKKNFQLKDKYEVEIFDEVNERLFLSVVIAIDDAIHN